MGQIMKDIGELLYTSRESRGLQLDEVACQLKVGRTYLVALEQGDVSQLPEEVYVLGYLRGYARILGLNSDDIVNRFKQDKDISAIKPNFVFPVEKIHAHQGHHHYHGHKHTKALPAPVILLVSLLMIAALAIIWYQGNLMKELPELPFSIMQQLGLNTDDSNADTQVAQGDVR